VGVAYDKVSRSSKILTTGLGLPEVDSVDLAWT